MHHITTTETTACARCWVPVPPNEWSGSVLSACCRTSPSEPFHLILCLKRECDAQGNYCKCMMTFTQPARRRGRIPRPDPQELAAAAAASVQTVDEQTEGTRPWGPVPKRNRGRPRASQHLKIISKSENALTLWVPPQGCKNPESLLFLSVSASIFRLSIWSKHASQKKMSAKARTFRRDE